MQDVSQLFASRGSAPSVAAAAPPPNSAMGGGVGDGGAANRAALQMTSSPPSSSSSSSSFETALLGEAMNGIAFGGGGALEDAFIIAGAQSVM